VALTNEEFLDAPHDHVVEFYTDDVELAGNVGSYLAEAIRVGGAAIAIATPSHREAFAAWLAGAGIDVADAEARGTLTFLDASEVEDTLLVDGRLAPHRFDKLIGDLIRDATARGRPVRAYGEVVAVMWAAGHVTAALELETLWNELGRQADFSLYCAYPVIAVEDGQVHALHEVCRRHSAVMAPPMPGLSHHEAPLEAVAVYLCTASGAAQARHFVAQTLRGWGRADLVDDAAVVATELASNAVLHARTGFTVSLVSPGDGIIRVAVRDASDALPRPRCPTPLEGSGRGLGLIEAIAAVWGVDVLPDGKVVWAQLRR
jgi:anti-sigma regulatory factor (Ser/Thr protein kinase)